MFTTGPKASSDVPDREQRSEIFRRWMVEYDIMIGTYQSVMGIVVSVDGVTLAVDKTGEFPSEALFANVGLAIHSGAVKKRSGVFPAGAGGPFDFSRARRKQRP